MFKVLILATKTQALTYIEHIIDTKFEVESYLLNSGTILKLDQSFRPDCIVVYIEGVNRQRLFGVMDLREDPAYQYIPMVVIGDEEDRNIFEQNVQPGADCALNASASKTEIRLAIERLASIQDDTIDKHILLVDDDPVFLRLMRSYLDDDYRVTAVKSGKLAMKFMEKQIPDLIILDYLMPEWDGATTYQLIRSKETTRDIPIIFLTGVTDRQMVMECLALKPQGYLVKPVSKPELMEKIKEVI